MKLPTPAATNLTALHNDNHTPPTEAPAPADFSDRDRDLDLDLDHVLYDGGWHWDNASDYVYDYDESVSSLPVEELSLLVLWKLSVKQWCQRPKATRAKMQAKV